MLRCSRPRGAILLLILSVWVGSGFRTARADERLNRLREAQAAGRQLIREGRYKEAIWTAGPWANVLRGELLAQIEHAKREGDRAKVISLYQAFFRYYPFGYLYWHHDSNEWDAAATEYVRLRQSRQDPADKDLDRDAAALEVYRKLAEHHKKRSHGKCAELADQIVEEYPRSMFAPAAALSVGHMTEQGYGGAAGIAVYEKYVARLREAGAPKRSVILLLFPQAHDCTKYLNKPEQLRKGLAIYQAIGKMTEIPYEKRYCVLRSAQVAVQIGDRDSLELSRKLFRQFLAEYPGVIEAHEARKGIVQSYLKAEQTAEADRALRELEKTAPEGTEFAEQLFAIAQAHFTAADYQKALAYLQEIVERFPQSRFAPLAQLGMGEAYEKTGDEEKMVAAYMKAAGLPRSPTSTNVMDASDSHNRANERLARYYMDKQDWAEALRWWIHWKPSSWCGTCQQSMEARRAESIAICLLHLGRHREAARACLDFLTRREGEGWAPCIATLVARLYRDAEQTADFLQMVEAFEEDKLREYEEKGYFKEQSREQKLKYLPTWPIREATRIMRLAEEGNVEALATICQAPRSSSRDIFEDPGNDWPSKEAAEALAGLGDRGVEAAKMLQGSWPIYALGKNPSPKALAALRERAENENWRNADNLAYAIALHGEAGRELLAELAAKPKNHKNYATCEAAKRWLGKLDSGPIASASTWPRPEPGTLPTDLAQP